MNVRSSEYLFFFFELLEILGNINISEFVIVMLLLKRGYLHAYGKFKCAKICRMRIIYEIFKLKLKYSLKYLENGGNAWFGSVSSGVIMIIRICIKVLQSSYYILIIVILCEIFIFSHNRVIFLRVQKHRACGHSFVKALKRRLYYYDVICMLLQTKYNTM